MLVMALEAINQIERDTNQNIDGFEMRNATFISAVTIPTDEEGIETHVSLRDARESSGNMDSCYEFSIRTYQDTSALEVCHGFVKAIHANERPTQTHESHELRESARIVMFKTQTLMNQCPSESHGQSLYNRLYKLSYHYGDSFRRIEKVHYNSGDEAVGSISVFEDAEASPSIIHPATLDGILQMTLPAATMDGNVDTAIMIPTRLDRLWLSSSRRIVDASTTKYMFH